MLSKVLESMMILQLGQQRLTKCTVTPSHVFVVDGITDANNFKECNEASKISETSVTPHCIMLDDDMLCGVMLHCVTLHERCVLVCQASQQGAWMWWRTRLSWPVC